MAVSSDQARITEGVYVVRDILPFPNARKPMLWRLELIASTDHRTVFLYDGEIPFRSGLPRLGSIIWARLYRFTVQGHPKTHLQAHQSLS
ncbi:hypothetical protein C8D92_104108 [Tamilnaduibacter salinus]|uniref:Uncharacterized protein n=1 Tax=Tamilnaduibacter salinus TaxID=1484056 RepID=A0A2U1CX87_9GAMM|nr:hypothetical protein [Tamilnaduibacter salinus]PVY76877.1 hypothetical protein C8D92_104108 [Tamilnaduibacter salinus]